MRSVTSIILLAVSASAYVDKLVDRAQQAEATDLANELDDTVVAKGGGQAPAPSPKSAPPSPAPQFFARSPGTAKFTTVPRKKKTENPDMPVLEFATPDYSDSKRSWWAPPPQAGAPPPAFFARSPGAANVKTGYSWGSPAPPPPAKKPGYNKWGAKEDEKGWFDGFFDPAVPRVIDDELRAGEAGLAGQLKRDKQEKLDQGEIRFSNWNKVLMEKVMEKVSGDEDPSTTKVLKGRDPTRDIRPRALPQAPAPAPALPYNQFQQKGFNPYMQRPIVPIMPQVRASPVRGPLAQTCAGATSIPALVLIGLFAGSGVAFAISRLRSHATLSQ